MPTEPAEAERDKNKRSINNRDYSYLVCSCRRYTSTIVYIPGTPVQPVLY